MPTARGPIPCRIWGTTEGLGGSRSVSKRRPPNNQPSAAKSMAAAPPAAVVLGANFKALIHSVFCVCVFFSSVFLLATLFKIHQG